MDWQLTYTFNFTPGIYRRGCAAALWISASPLMQVIIRLCQLTCLLAAARLALGNPVPLTWAAVLPAGVCFIVGVLFSPTFLSWSNYPRFLMTGEESPFGLVTVSFTGKGFSLRNPDGTAVDTDQFAELETSRYLVYLYDEVHLLVLPKDVVHRKWLEENTLP